MLKEGSFAALISSVLFGISPALVKWLAGDISPLLVAGLLYLGSGIGLLPILMAKRQNAVGELSSLTGKQRLRLAASILFGGVLAPLCLAYGIKYATAVEVSLLLCLETVATSLFAAFLFKEHVGGRVWAGKALLVLGAVFITTQSFEGFALSVPGLAVLGACAFWGLDNNLTREIEQLSPMVLACVRGFAAGAFNTLLAFAFSGASPATGLQELQVMVIGAFSYGVSLVFFIHSLRLIGASRTGTYFATGPFFGMLLGIALLHERPAESQWVAALVMMAGLYVIYSERHEHRHTHKALGHRHLHSHDEHHQHSHDAGQGAEPHDHWHTHEPITHSHWHLPDIHHRHSH